MDFVALRLSPGTGVTSMLPVRVRYTGANVVLPVRMRGRGGRRLAGLVALRVRHGTLREHELRQRPDRSLVADMGLVHTHTRLLFAVRERDLEFSRCVRQCVAEQAARLRGPADWADWSLATQNDAPGVRVTRLRTDPRTALLDTDLLL